MALVFKPVTVISITGRVLHKALTVAFAEHMVALVRGGRVRDVRTFAVEITVLEVAAVVLARESGIDGLGSREGLRWVIASGCPQIPNQLIGVGEKTRDVQFGASVCRINR